MSKDTHPAKQKKRHCDQKDPFTFSKATIKAAAVVIYKPT